MKEENQIEYFYDETETLLHFVFKKGQNNLLIVCLNPKESTEQIKVNHNIEKLSSNNGYDGFVIVFINPNIQDNSVFVEKSNNEINENYLTIGALLDGNQFNFKTALVCWGQEIDSFNQTFLKKSAYKILNDLHKEDLKFVCIGKDKNGNPLAINDKNSNTKFKNFEIKNYCANIKKTIKINPEISINGIAFK